MTPWTAAYQAPPSMGFSRQEYWSGVPSPSPGNMVTWDLMLSGYEGEKMKAFRNTMLRSTINEKKVQN